MNNVDGAQRPVICMTTSHRNDAIGGIESFVNSISKWLREKNLKTIVVTRKLSFLRPFSVNIRDTSPQPVKTPTIKTVRAGKFTYNIYLFFHSLIATLYLINLVKKYKISIVHAQDNFAGFSAVLASKFCRILVILHSHGPEFFHRYSFVLRAFNTPLDKYVGSRVNRIVVTDRITFDYFVSLGSPKSKLLTIPTGIDLHLFNEEGKGNINGFEQKIKNQDRFIVGYIGRLSREKNVITLLKAFAEIISRTEFDFKLVLVGDGPERLALEKFVATRGMHDSILFTGWRTDVQKLLTIFDVFVLPSLFEGVPIALLEAMAAGKSIIASNIPRIREIVRDREETILINPYSVEELEQALLSLYNDPHLRLKLGSKAKKRAELYDVNRVYEEILKVYKETLLRKTKNFVP